MARALSFQHLTTFDPGRDPDYIQPETASLSDLATPLLQPLTTYHHERRRLHHLRLSDGTPSCVASVCQWCAELLLRRAAKADLLLQQSSGPTSSGGSFS